MAKAPAARTRHHAEKAATYRGSLSLLATLVMCFTFLCVVLLERPAVGTALHGLAAGSGKLSRMNVVVLAQLVGAPLLCAIAAYALAAQAIALLRLALYRGALHRYTESWLRRYAPLRERGIRISGAAYGSDGTPLAGRERLLDSAAIAERSLLVLGAEGTGKTAALHALAFELTRRRALIPLYLRRAPLPIVVQCTSLNDDAIAGQAGFIQFLQRQVCVFGTKGLAAGLPRLLRRGRIVLLCDGMDELVTTERSKTSSVLAGLLATGKGRATALITCNLRTYEDAPRSLSPLKTFERVVLHAIQAEDAVEALRRREMRSGARRLVAGDVQNALERHRLVVPVGNPAALAALMSEGRGIAGWPHGRAELLRSYARTLCAKAVGDGAQTERCALLLGALAVSLRMADTRTLWIPNSRSVGREVADWLDETPPLTPTEVRMDAAMVASPEEAERVCQEALKGGILARTADGAGLAFANGVLEATFAAWWLDMMDDGLGRVNAELLYPRWALPVVLWAGAQGNPADLVSRLHRLADTPESTATRAGLSSREAARPATLALSLAALCEGLGGMLAREADSSVGSQRAEDVAQQHLRDLLDDMQRLMAHPVDEDRLRAALEEVERRCGPEMVDSIAFLARLPKLNRLVRAQLAVLLGLLASPAAVAGIVGLLDEPDAVLRQAVNAAVVLAGAVCVGPLQAALQTTNDRVRARAEETLALLGGDAIDAALASLEASSGEQRASAARTLGRLRARRATEALVRRLNDEESAVGVAAARALGQIADGEARVALERHTSSTDVALRAASAQALGQCWDVESVPVLMRLLGDAEPTVRAAAAEALGVLGDERALVSLQERRDDPDPWTQHAVVLALKRMGKE